MKREHILPAELAAQLEELTRFLIPREGDWIEVRSQELAELPAGLRPHVEQLGVAVDALKKLLKENGCTTLRELAAGENGASGDLDVIDSLKSRLQQTRQVVQVQQLLAKNLMAYARGLSILVDSRQNPVYSDNRRGTKRGQSLNLEG